MKTQKPRRTSRKIALILFAVLVVGGVAIKTLGDTGELDTIWDHPLPDCRLVPGVTGAEDLASVDSGARVLISVSDRQGLAAAQKSGVYVYDGTTLPQLVFATDGEPQGISAVDTEYGARIFLVVHRAQHDFVQIFDWSLGELKVVREMPVEGVKTLNGIVGVDTESFYASQDLGMKAAVGQELEKLLRLPLGKLWYGDKDRVRVVREKIIYPNGLAISADKKVLYVASMLSSSLIVFDRDASGEALRWRNQIQLKTAPDNLKWAGDGLLVAAHPKLLRLMAHSHKALSFHAPSQLIRIEGLPDQAKLTELYSSKEGPLEAITGAVPMGLRYVMGAVFKEGLLDCEASSEIVRPL